MIRAGLVATGLAAAVWLAPTGTARAQGDPAADLRTLNDVRRAAGMATLHANAALALAARNHAVYLARNGQGGHSEQPGRAGFTGRQPKQRALHARYPHQDVSENIAAGYADGEQAIRGLMGAIYHRFGFLAFAIDEVGMGRAAPRPGEAIYVYNMGNRALAALCTDPAPEHLLRGAGSYVQPCARALRVRAEVHAQIAAQQRARNPRVVLWPPPEARAVNPAFFEESPDPLPDRSVSGYPLSVQFNPAAVRQAEPLAFRLFLLPAGHPAPGPEAREVTSTRLLSASHDPHGKFTPLQFALFPLERLAWNRRYRAEARFRVDGREERLVWSFATRDLGLPLYATSAQGETLPVRPGVTYAVYVPPSRGHARIGRWQWSQPKSVQTHVEAEDPNTLRVRVQGPPCAEVTVELDGGRGFKLRLAAADTTAGPRPPRVLYAACGEVAADFRVVGKGEVLPLRSGRRYRVYVQPRGGHGLGAVRWSHPSDVAAEISRQEGNTLAVRIRGRPGQQVRIDLGPGRSIVLQVAR